LLLRWYQVWITSSQQNCQPISKMWQKVHADLTANIIFRC
jgi:hypothetical protein